MSNKHELNMAEDKRRSAALGLARRRLLKGGIGVAPIALTLVSRPVLACNSSTPSAFGSCNASRPDTLVPLTGKSPDYWKTSGNFTQWPSGCVPNGASATTFGGAGFNTGNSGIASTTTLLAVLGYTETAGPKGVAKSAVAAFLNAKKYPATAAILSVGQITGPSGIWTQYSAVSYYEPTAGIRWYDCTPLFAACNTTGTAAGVTANTGGTGGIIGYLNTTWL